MSVALAFKISDIEQDQTLVDAVTKECEGCDPDNPRAVARDKCKLCGGTGRQALAAGDVAREISAAKGGGGESSEEGELFLEY